MVAMWFYRNSTMELSVYAQTGTDTGRKVSIPTTLLVDKEKNTHVLYLEVKRHLAAQRQGTHKTKERGEVEGSTRKIKKQKGTGTARSGSIKSPIFRGGGRVFGPQPRDYTLRLSKQARRLARRLALSEKLQEQSLTLVEKLFFSEPKTKQYVAFLHALELENKRSLLVTADEVPLVLRLASRNLQQVKVLPARQLSAYDILSHKHLIIEEKTLSTLESLWS